MSERLVLLGEQRPKRFERVCHGVDQVGAKREDDEPVLGVGRQSLCDRPDLEAAPRPASRPHERR